MRGQTHSVSGQMLDRCNCKPVAGEKRTRAPSSRGQSHADPPPSTMVSLDDDGDDDDLGVGDDLGLDLVVVSRTQTHRHGQS